MLTHQWNTKQFLLFNSFCNNYYLRLFLFWQQYHQVSFLVMHIIYIFTWLRLSMLFGNLVICFFSDKLIIQVMYLIMTNVLYHITKEKIGKYYVTISASMTIYNGKPWLSILIQWRNQWLHLLVNSQLLCYYSFIMHSMSYVHHVLLYRNVSISFLEFYFAYLSSFSKILFYLIIKLNQRIDLIFVLNAPMHQPACSLSYIM